MHSAHFMRGVYRDLRDSSRYHTDPNCPIGRRIPAQLVHPDRPVSAKLCRTCASGGNDAAPVLLAM